MNFEEKRLHQTLIKLTRTFSRKDFFEYRKNRNWQKYDAMHPIERLQLILREISEYQKGYFEDDNYYGDEENSIDEYY
jgi:hypothetical protein